MKKTSSAVTGSATFAAAGIAPLVEWLANNVWHLNMPPQVVLIVAAALVTAGHYGVNVVASQPAAGVTAHTTVTRESGFARVGALAMLAVLSLAGCSLMSPTIDKVEAGAMQAVVQSSERTICRDLPVGAWMAYYGTNAERAKGWQALCFNSIKAPLNSETVAAILKVYPGFQQAADAGTAPPVVPPTPTVVPPQVAPPAVVAAPQVVPPAPTKPRRTRRAAAPKPTIPAPTLVPAQPTPAAQPLPARVAPAAPAQTSLLSAPVVRP